MESDDLDPHNQVTACLQLCTDSLQLDAPLLHAKTYIDLNGVGAVFLFAKISFPFLKKKIYIYIYMYVYTHTHTHM